MSEQQAPITFDELAVGDIFYITQPYRQYYVKLQPFRDANDRLCNAEELEGGKAIQWRASSRFQIYRDDGRQSWKGPSSDDSEKA